MRNQILSWTGDGLPGVVVQGVFSGSRYDSGTRYPGRYCKEATPTRTFNNLLRPAFQSARPMPTSKPNSCNLRLL